MHMRFLSEPLKSINTGPRSVLTVNFVQKPNKLYSLDLHGSKWRVMKAEMRSHRFPFELNLSRRYKTKCNSGVVQRSLGKGCSKRNINMHPNGHRADNFQLKNPGTGRTNLSLSYRA